ncbi:glycine-rich domain-containing protein [Novosphingobium album (ex Liu et al. 2023)]|uniref:Glycine-rich domain-containing protein-like n=1 Tax=Novosphingobium album (ex Liu et al. 2023) TaxID=3031130 RepID=A0ABT5WTX4_9SPHN|nr:hypothetical protein [Novosphingobium album (ex Liu et al. 2023)]MDE8653324.1 hypothetical protein [Novosphingobium album (ex Liu et al. 2023)]
MTDNRDAVRVIAGLNLTAVKYKLMVKKGWSISKLERVELLYKRFLTLTYLYPSRTLVPNEDIDEFWHAHILDTRRYASDMQHCLGYFLHHFPYFGLRGQDDKEEMSRTFQETVQLYEAEFGFGEPSYNSSASQSDGVVCGNDGCNNRFEDADFTDVYERTRMGFAA